MNYKRKTLLSLLVDSTARRLYQSLNAMEKFAFFVTTGSQCQNIARQFPLPCVDELIDNIRNLSIYSVIDLRSRYFQISLKEEDREKTAFVLPWGKYQWKRMPQALPGAPFTFAENI